MEEFDKESILGVCLFDEAGERFIGSFFRRKLEFEFKGYCLESLKVAFDNSIENKYVS
jgi:hypothetical protein